MARIDGLDGIDDGLVRRLVAVSLHVRSYLPFYVLGTFMAVTLAVIPSVARNGPAPSSSSSSFANGATGGLATTAEASGGAGRIATDGLAAGVASLTSVADGGFAPDLSITDDTAGASNVAAPPGGSLADQSGSTGPGVGAPSFDPSSDVPETPEPCKITPPSPAPAVDPGREVDGAQSTAEAAARQQLPVRAADTAAPVTEAAACNVPEAPVAVPSVPLPATPVAKSDTSAGSGWWSRLVGLLR